MTITSCAGTLCSLSRSARPAEYHAGMTVFLAVQMTASSETAAQFLGFRVQFGRGYRPNHDGKPSLPYSENPAFCGVFAFWLWTSVPCPVARFGEKFAKFSLSLRPCGLHDCQVHRMVFVFRCRSMIYVWTRESGFMASMPALRDANGLRRVGGVVAFACNER